MQLQLNILPLLNWLDFCLIALLSSYSVMCSPWRPLSSEELADHNKLPFTLKGLSVLQDRRRP